MSFINKKILTINVKKITKYLMGTTIRDFIHVEILILAVKFIFWTANLLIKQDISNF